MDSSHTTVIDMAPSVRCRPEDNLRPPSASAQEAGVIPAGVSCSADSRVRRATPGATPPAAAPPAIAPTAPPLDKPRVKYSAGSPPAPITPPVPRGGAG